MKITPQVIPQDPGFNLETYGQQRKERREREIQRAEKQKVELVYDPSILDEYRKEQAEAQLPGQMRMDLKPAEMSDQVKLMRFQAAQVDKLSLKLDHLNDTLHQILRVLRKE